MPPVNGAATADRGDIAMSHVRCMTLVLAAVAALAGAAHAQQVFKYVMPNGQVVYSDKPVPGGRLMDELAPPPPPAQGMNAPAPAAPSAGQGQAVRERLADRESQFQQAQANLNDARANLVAAERQLANGKEPLPGERTGIVGGGTRLNDNYWARQRDNEAAVANARQAVQDATNALNQLR